MSSIRVWSGKQVDPFSLQPGDIGLVDIAQSLSRICRFNGHIKQDWYSVAEHAYHVSYLVDPEIALEALHHEDAEAIVGDQVSPIKHHETFAFFRNLEHRIEQVISEDFNLEYPWDPRIKVADLQILAWEKMYVRDGTGTPPATGPIQLKCWSPTTAAFKFIQRHNELYAKRLGWAL